MRLHSQGPAPRVHHRRRSGYVKPVQQPHGLGFVKIPGRDPVLIALAEVFEVAAPVDGKTVSSQLLAQPVTRLRASPVDIRQHEPTRRENVGHSRYVVVADAKLKDEDGRYDIYLPSDVLLDVFGKAADGPAFPLKVYDRKIDIRCFVRDSCQPRLEAVETASPFEHPLGPHAADDFGELILDLIVGAPDMLALNQMFAQHVDNVYLRPAEPFQGHRGVDVVHDALVRTGP